VSGCQCADAVAACVERVRVHFKTPSRLAPSLPLRARLAKLVGGRCHAPRRCHIRQDCSRAAQGRRAGGGGDGGEGATRRRCKLVVARQARWREGRRWREGASLLDVYMVHCVWTWSLTALCVARVPTPGRCKSAERPTDCCKRTCALDPRTGGAHSCTALTEWRRKERRRQVFLVTRRRRRRHTHTHTTQLRCCGCSGP